MESYTRTGENFIEVDDVPIEFRITQVKQYLPYLRASEQMLFTAHQQVQQALGISRKTPGICVIEESFMEEGEPLVIKDKNMFRHHRLGVAIPILNDNFRSAQRLTLVHMVA